MKADKLLELVGFKGSETIDDKKYATYRRWNSKHDVVQVVIIAYSPEVNSYYLTTYNESLSDTDKKVAELSELELKLFSKKIREMRKKIKKIERLLNRVI